MDKGKNTVIIEEIIEKYSGKMETPEVFSRFKGPCGDEMEFYLRFKDGTISGIKYHTSGCGWTSACGAIVCFYADGRNIEEALFISPGLISKTLGGLPPDHEHCPILACSSFYSALGKWMVCEKNGK
ncbi:MAG: iron-sulfur cluster assembly scaffold protein [Elusimicrobia bacterium]|nr:iron-sulfur cluster assembly scaffold protein [Elusimicrobiota bacterium]